MLTDTISIGWRHFIEVTIQVWLLRASMVCLQALFVIAPAVIVQRMLIPQLAHALNAPWLVQTCVLLIAIGVVAINSVLCTFAAVYDARAYVAFRQVDR